MKQGIKLGFSKKEAAAESSLSVRTLDYLIQRGVIRAVKIGKRVVIPGSELTRLIERGITRKTESKGESS